MIFNKVAAGETTAYANVRDSSVTFELHQADSNAVVARQMAHLRDQGRYTVTATTGANDRITLTVKPNNGPMGRMAGDTGLVPPR